MLVWLVNDCMKAKVDQRAVIDRDMEQLVGIASWGSRDSLHELLSRCSEAVQASHKPAGPLVGHADQCPADRTPGTDMVTWLPVKGMKA
jgi:hypothetical protein